MVKETFITCRNEEPGSIYQRLSFQHKHNYSAIIVDGDVTATINYGTLTYYSGNCYESFNLIRHVYVTTLDIIERFGGLYSIIYVKEEWKTYIVFRSDFQDNDLHSKELRDKFLNAVRGCSSIIKENNPEFNVVELRHYLAVIPEGCTCRHCNPHRQKANNMNANSQQAQSFNFLFE